MPGISYLLTRGSSQPFAEKLSCGKKRKYIYNGWPLLLEDLEYPLGYPVPGVQIVGIIKSSGADPGSFVLGCKLWLNFLWRITFFRQRRPRVSSICERRSPLAREILLCEQRRTDHRRVPKNNYIFEYPWNLVWWQNATHLSLKKTQPVKTWYFLWKCWKGGTVRCHQCNKGM